MQSFAWGPGNPLGNFAAAPGFGAQAVYLLLAIFVAGKFYAVFALLFGHGLTLQTRRMLRLARGRRAVATRMYLRRLAFLLAVGALHAVLLYFGDILVTYALCALVPLALAWARTRTLLRATRAAWIAAAAGLLWMRALDSLAGGDASDAIAAAIARARTIYVTAGYFGQLPQRIDDALGLFGAGFWLAAVQVVALMLLGALAARLGWLRRPQRHPRLWRTAARVGLGVGLPCALLGGWLNLRATRAAPDGGFGPDALLLAASTLLTFAYLAAAVRWRASPFMRRALRWLAPAGRMPLTNYLAQSLAMGALLSGWGLGLAAHATAPELALGAIAFFVAQLLASRVLLARVGQGPLEALWRRATYGAGTGRVSATSCCRPAGP